MTSGKAVEAKWTIKRIANRREGKRPYVWQVICPETPPELTWDNDFGRGMRCGCQRFPTEGKATRYVARMETAQMEAALAKDLAEFLTDTSDSN